MARKSPAFSFYPDSWIGGTMRMPPVQRAAYIDLLSNQWLEGAFTFACALLVCRGVPERDVQAVLDSKFEFSNGLYSNRRIEEEREKQLAKSTSGKIGGSKTQANFKRTGKQTVKQTSSERANEIQASDSDSVSDSVSITDSRKEDSSAVAKPTTKPPPVENPVLEFPCVGQQKIWGLAESQVSAWSELYPLLDVLGECRKALAWVQANERKTASGMAKFLVRWLNKASDGSRSRSGSVEGKRFLTPAQQREENMRGVLERARQTDIARANGQEVNVLKLGVK